MNNEEIKAEKPNNAEANKKAEETKVTVNVNEGGSSWLKPTPNDGDRDRGPSAPRSRSLFFLVYFLLIYY